MNTLARAITLKNHFATDNFEYCSADRNIHTDVVTNGGSGLDVASRTSFADLCSIMELQSLRSESRVEDVSDRIPFNASNSDFYPINSRPVTLDLFSSGERFDSFTQHS